MANEAIQSDVVEGEKNIAVMVRLKPDTIAWLQELAAKIAAPGVGVATVMRMLVDAAHEEGVDILPPTAPKLVRRSATVLDAAGKPLKEAAPRPKTKHRPGAAA